MVSRSAGALKRNQRRALLCITGAFDVGGGVAALNRMVVKALSTYEGGDTQLTILALNEPSATPLDAFYADPARTTWRPFGAAAGPFARAVWGAVLRQRWDIIFADHVGVASVLYPFARVGLCRYVVSCNGLELSPKLLGLRRRLALFGAHRRLAISPTTRDALQAWFPRLPVVVYELGLDPKLPLTMPPRETLPPPVLVSVSGREELPGSHMVLCVGRLWKDQRHKGQDALIRAMRLVRERFPAAQLVLVGSGDWIDELRALAFAQGVGDSVFLPGFVTDAVRDALYSHCAVFAMPSNGEGFGLVYLEAMRWSKPCVGGAADAARDVIVDGETGLLLPAPHDPLLLAEALCQLLKDPDAAQAMGRAGRRRLEARFLFGHFQERFLRGIGWA